jgi:mannose/cellobiose epimerase-like protein (N-acyl-D-glucosamine 2-epimerase family)
MVDPKYPGSYRPSRDRDFSALKKTYNNSDVFTHWFEALLHLWDVTSGADRSEVTASINLSGNFLVQHMMVVEPGHPDSAYVAYYYGEDWKPSRKPFSGDLWDGSGYASPGHGIELAFLLSWANERGLGDATWVAAGERLINFCLRHAFDRATGGMLYDVCAYSGAPLARSAEYVYWPQCEAARALLHYAVVRGKTEYLGQFKQVEKILMDDFTDKAYGGLYPNLDRRLKPRADYKGDMWKTNYHFSMYVSEVHRLAATYPESIKK